MGILVLRGMFWRRRNKRLDARLNTVVETAEQTRKSYRPKPRRVVIDTSFVDQQAADPGSSDRENEISQADLSNDHDEALGDVQADASEIQSETEDTAGHTGSDGEQFDEYDHATEFEPAQQSAHDIAARAALDGDAIHDDAVLLEEALELLDVAERREAEAAARADEAVAEAEDLRTAVAQLRTEMDALKGAPDVLAPDTAALFSSGDDAQAELTSLRESLAQSQQREAETRDQKTNLAAKVAELLDEIEQERSAREAAENAAAEFKSELCAHEENRFAHGNSIDHQAADGDPRADAGAELEELRSRITDLESQLEQRLAQHGELEASRDRALNDAETLREQVSVLEAAPSTQRDGVAGDADEYMRAGELADEVAALKAQTEAQACELEDLRAAYEAAQTARDDSQSEAALLQERITAYESGETISDAIAERERNAVEQAEAARAEATELRVRADGLAAELEEVQEARRRAEEQHEAACASIEQLTAQIAGLAEKDAGIAQLEESERAAAAQAEAAQAQLDEQQGRTEELEADVARLTTELERERTAHAETETALGAALETNQQLETQLAKLDESEAQRAQLVERERTAIEQADAARQELNELQANWEAVTRDLEQERAMRAELEAERDALSEGSAEADGAKQLLATVQQDLASLQARFDIIEAEAAKAHSGRLEAEAQRDKALKQVAGLELQVSNLEHAVSQAQQLANASASIPHASGTAAASDGARFATDKPVIYRSKKQDDPNASQAAKDAAGGSHAERREARVAARLKGTIQKDTELTVLQCFVVDRSDSGAKIEIIPDKINPSIGIPFEGEVITLKFGTAFEKTTVSCTVRWIRDNACGVQFNGPPHVEFATMPKRATKKAMDEDQSGDKGGKSGKGKRGSGRRKSAFA